jgi:ATP-dependent DNA helicase DinG
LSPGLPNATPDRRSASRLGDLLSNPGGVQALAGLDGLLEEQDDRSRKPAREVPPLALTPEACARIRAEVARAGGREVCFLARVEDRRVLDPRAVARGNHEAVLAAARDAEPGGVMIHNHPSGVLEPSDADLAVSARLWEEGLGSAITDNEASGLYVVVEPPEPEVRVPLDLDALEARVSPGGALARLHPGFEDRQGQRQMLRLVAERFNEGGVGIVEAGTGTGKSLAYLLPAAEWALQNRERTVISTNTINLQEQLVGKDLPLVESVLGEKLDWALVKGRGNYISIRRAILAAAEAPTLFPDGRTEELGALLEWTRSTRDGSLADLPFVPSDEVWDEVRSDPDVCLRARCPHFGDCFYQRARRDASRARLLIVNHHLLFTDLAVRRVTDNYRQAAVLPAYRRLVLDEAHNVEDAATSHLGVDLTRAGLFRLLSRLDRQGKGILAALRKAVDGDAGDELQRRIEERVRPQLDEAREALSGLIDVVEPLAASPEGGAVRLGPGGEREPADDPQVRELLDATVAAFGRLERELGELRRRLPAEEPGDALDARGLDLVSVERRLSAAAFGLRVVLDPRASADDLVRWLELRGKPPRQNLVLAAAPVEPGKALRESLFAKLDTVVLTSATLATNRRFDFLRRRLGLSPDELARQEAPLELREALIPSPFDFRSQTRLVVPTDMPEAGGTGSAELQRETARVTREVAELTGGGLFVLFTSYRALRAVAQRLRADGLGARYPLFVHGEESRARLLDGFIRSGSGILLGTTSFWEGVDVPGHPLRALIIQKLPFRVPTEPVTSARIEAVEREGGDAFWEFLLPLAALRLKQGFGRLVRSRQDRGVVVLLDDRILRKRYGRYLRDSLPEAPLLKGLWADVKRPLRDFYGPS